MLSYQADAEAAGATIAFRTPVIEAAIAGGRMGYGTGGSEEAEVESDIVINAAGLDAWDFSAQLSGLERASVPPRCLAKGNYFTLSGAVSPFRHLVYPVPDPGGLGIHLTFDLAGQARFGPDVQWIDHILIMPSDPGRGRQFYAAIPPLLAGPSRWRAGSSLRGHRPKTATNGQSDFIIHGPGETGHKGYVALYGIKSPG